MNYKLNELLIPYKEINRDSLFEPVAIGKYGIRKRSEIYKKELSNDYSKNKVIRKNTLSIGLGSNQIDVGVLTTDEIYSVSPAYNTFKIDTQKVCAKYLELSMKYNNSFFFKKHSIATARQGKKVDMVGLLGESINIPNIDNQLDIIKKVTSIEEMIQKEKEQLNYFNELIKSRFNLNDKQADWKSLKDVATIVGGSTPKTQNKEYWNGNNKWITPAEIDKDTFYVFDSERHITEAGVKSCTLQLLPINTVLLTSRAPIGKVAITGAEMYCNQGFKNIICSKHLHHYYVYYLLKFNVKYLNAIGSGTTFKEISKTVVENIRIPVPDYRNQELFASFTEQINKLKFNCQQRIKLYQELLDKKMDEYFD